MAADLEILSDVNGDSLTILAGGGRQSKSAYRSELLPPRAMLKVSAIMKGGEERHPSMANGTPNWHLIPITNHLGRAVTHIFQWICGDRSDDHLGNAATRLLMALELKEIVNERAATSKTGLQRGDEKDGVERMVSAGDSGGGKDAEARLDDGFRNSRR